MTSEPETVHPASLADTLLDIPQDGQDFERLSVSVRPDVQSPGDAMLSYARHALFEAMAEARDAGIDRADMISMIADVFDTQEVSGSSPLPPTTATRLKKKRSPCGDRVCV